jgi:hypothetical protein
MRMPVALSLAVPLALRAMAYAEKQTITMGPWAIATSYKGDKFDLLDEPHRWRAWYYVCSGSRWVVALPSV